MRYRSYGITQEDQEDPVSKIIPERVQQLVDIYHKNHVGYPWNAEDRGEQHFEYWKQKDPNSYKYDIDAIYRIRGSETNQRNIISTRRKGDVLMTTMELKLPIL